MNVEPGTEPTNEGAHDVDAGTDTPAGGAGADAASDAAELAPPADPDAAALSAFEKGAAEAESDGDAAPAPTPAPVAEGEGKPPVVEKPPAAAAEDDAAKAKKEADAAVESEIKSLGLRDKASDRFRQLAATEREAKVLKAEVEPLRERAQRLEEWESQIAATGASPEQFGATVNYTALAVRANNGDLAAAKLAYDSTKAEHEHWAKMLGLEAAGVDPLAEHADLKALVESGDMPRANALEVVQARAAKKIHATTTERTTKEQRDQADYEAGVNAAMVEINKHGAQLKATDPGFDQKLVMLKPAIDIIRSTMHPSRWPAAIKHAYALLPAVTAPAAAPPVTPMPIRPTGGAAVQQRKPKTDLEAFEIGAASVR